MNMVLVEAVKVEPPLDLQNDEEVEFVWGIKKGKGGKRKEVQFYESFTYDGVKYALHDCVWMHKEGETPYIGKLIKIWQNPDKSRKVKVHWFFQQSEILYHLKDIKVAENEIFLACGEGTGLANVNPLEAIAGKCNVVCISEDNRNPQPSEEEVKTADYVFYRSFDVGSCTILDKIDDKVGGLDVKYVFNRKESQNPSNVSKSSDQKDDKIALDFQATDDSFGIKRQNNIETAKASHLIGKSDARQDAELKGSSASGEQNSQVDSGVSKTSGKSSHLVGKSDAVAQSLQVRPDALHLDHVPVQIVNSKTATTVVQKKNASYEENASCKVKNDKDEKKVNKPPSNLVEGGERGKLLKDPGFLDDRPSKRIKVNGSVTLSEGKGVNSVQKSTVCINDKKVLGTSVVPSEETKKSGDSKLSSGLDKNRNIRKDSVPLDIRPSKKAHIDTLSEDKGVNSVQKSTVCRNDKKVLGTSVEPSERIKKSGDSPLDKNMKIRKDGVALDIKPMKKTNMDALKVKEDGDKSNTTIGKVVDTLGKLPKPSPKEVDKNMKIGEDSVPLNMKPSKKANIDSLKVKEDRDKSNMSIGKAVDNLGKLPKTSPKEVERTERKSFEVTPRPVAESSKWFKAPPWEEVMQTSNEQGTLILLENLSPDYTSGEVEDIIWHSCRENCTAKMVQHIAFSSPYSGRALAAFKTREAAERVQKKLNDGCLMLTNHVQKKLDDGCLMLTTHRPLIASFVSLPKTEGNTPSFSGHLCLDKLRQQLQREMKEAVSTSHCSQPNTIEHEMSLEWRLLQARSDSWWERLYKQQSEDMIKVTSELKRK